MCRIVFSRNQKTGLKECNSSFMYRKSPTNTTKSTYFTSTINSKECQPTCQRDTRTRLSGLRKIPIIGTQYWHSYTGYWRRTGLENIVIFLKMWRQDFRNGTPPNLYILHTKLFYILLRMLFWYLFRARPSHFRAIIFTSCSLYRTLTSLIGHWR